MDETLRAEILIALNSLSQFNTNPPNIAGMQSYIAQHLQQAIIRYTHTYVAQQINNLVLANQAGQPAHLNPPLPG
jgi:hypothetical protein